MTIYGNNLTQLRQEINALHSEQKIARKLLGQPHTQESPTQQSLAEERAKKISVHMIALALLRNKAPAQNLPPHGESRVQDIVNRFTKRCEQDLAEARAHLVGIGLDGILQVSG